MAIKVGGTTVVDDSRQLSNIASVDATTVAALGAAGISGGGGIELTTSEDIVEGDTLAFNITSGKVEKVARIGGSGYNNLGSLQTSTTGRMAHVSGNVFAVCIENSSGSTQLVLARWNPSTNSFTAGTPISFTGQSNKVQGAIVLYSAQNNKVIWLVSYLLTNHRLQGLSFTPDTTNLTLTSLGNDEIENAITNATENTVSATYNSTEDKVFVLYRDSSGFGRGRVVDFGGAGSSTITIGSETGPSGSNFGSSGDFDMHSVLSDGSKVIAVYYHAGDFKGVAGTISGSSVTWGSPYTFGGTAHTYYSHGNLFKHVSGSYGAFAMFNASQGGIVQFDVSSSNVISNLSFNNITISSANTSYPVYTSYDSSGNRLFYGSYDGSGTYAGNIQLNTSAPTQVSQNNVTLLSNSSRVESDMYNPSAGFAFYGLNNSNLFGYYAPVEDNFNDFIGIAKEAASANNTVKIANAGQIATGLTGLTAGNFYRIQYDGTFQDLGGWTSNYDNLNQAQRARKSGRALTSTTMLMLNDFMSN